MLGVRYATEPSYSTAPPVAVVKFVPDWNLKGASDVVPTAVTRDEVNDPLLRTELTKFDVADVLPSVMLADEIAVVAAATAMVARRIELLGVDGATGDAAAVPAMTWNATVFVDPE